jgi:uncharacterized membrane protein
VLTLLVFSFTLSLAALLQAHSTVPMLSTHTAGYICMVCLAVFFYLIDHLGRSLRPSGAMRIVAWLGRRVLDHVYPPHSADSVEALRRDAAAVLEGKAALTIPSPRDGVVLAFDEAGLLALAMSVFAALDALGQLGVGLRESWVKETVSV